jgi:DNA-binding CsgD family transcriptional regulator
VIVRPEAAVPDDLADPGLADEDAMSRGPIPDDVAAMLAAIVDDLPGGVLVMDGAGRVVHANRTARAIVARRDGVAIGRNRRIALADAEAARQLDTVVQAVLDGRAPGGPLRAPCRRGRGAYMLMVVRPSGPARGGRAASGAVVMIHDHAPVPQAPRPVLRQIFGLTRREAELAAALCSGSGPSAIALATGVSINTVRFHLKSIYAKTGARSQADLVGIVIGTLGSLGARGGSEP